MRNKISIYIMCVYVYIYTLSVRGHKYEQFGVYILCQAMLQGINLFNHYHDNSMR